MTASKLYTSGFTDLVSVVPPDAEISDTSSLSPDTRGKVPGKRRLDGTWCGYPFTRDDPPTEADVAKWESWGANIGLRADYFPGLDVDVDDPRLARFIIQKAQQILGPAPVRTSRDPRALLVYRTEEPFTRIAADVRCRGDEYTVEMLGKGRQYLVHGDHPSGSEYGWDGKPLWDYSPDDLTKVSVEDVRGFFSYLSNHLDLEVQGTGETKETSAPPQEQLEAPTLEQLRDVVEQIPNDYADRDDYIQIGCAIKAAGGEEAYEVFSDWADRWEQGTNDPETVRSDWERMHPPFRIGWPFLQALARERSDYNPAADVFEADPGKVRQVEEGTIHFPGLMDFTDTWVVERLSKRLADRLRYVPETSTYHIWGTG